MHIMQPSEILSNMHLAFMIEATTVKYNKEEGQAFSTALSISPGPALPTNPANNNRHSQGDVGFF